MNIFLTEEECLGCGIVFQASAELSQVDFDGKDFENHSNKTEY